MEALNVRPIKWRQVISVIGGQRQRIVKCNPSKEEMQAKRAPSWWRWRLAIADVATANLQLQLTTKAEKTEKSEAKAAKTNRTNHDFRCGCLRGAKIENEQHTGKNFGS